MTKRSRSSFEKRQKELARQAKQKEKQARRLETKERKAQADDGEPVEDPDIADIQPGPQPVSEDFS